MATWVGKAGWLDLGEHESPAMKDLQIFIMLRKSSGNWWFPSPFQWI